MLTDTHSSQVREPDRARLAAPRRRRRSVSVDAGIGWTPDGNSPAIPLPPSTACAATGWRETSLVTKEESAMTTSSVPTAPPEDSEPTETIGSHHRRSADPELSTRVTAALSGYLNAVARALNRSGVTVATVETTGSARGLFSGRIQLARQRGRDRGYRDAVELHWTETTGWGVTFRAARDDAVSPSRFLHADLTPHPDHVASFTDSLLRGEDLGVAYPARFRTPGADLATLAGNLAHCAHPTPWR
jgi:hypothetical protein